jgi:Domain of unknown function (DUF397)
VPRADQIRLAWRKSSHSTQNGSCVEVTTASTEGTHAVIAVRDSKNPTGAVLIFSDSDWLAFTARVKARELDVP